MSNSDVVVASNSDFGIVSKAQRGVTGGLGELPQSLNAMKGTLERFAKQFGIRLDGSAKEVALGAEKALRGQKSSRAIVANVSSDQGAVP